MVSGHDSMISAMLLFLGMMYDDPQKFWKVPVYAANIAFEVYNTKDTFSKDDYSQYVIKCFFNGKLINSEENKEEASFNLKDFIERVDKIAWGKKEIYDFCGIEEENTKHNNTLAAVFGIISAIFLIIIVILVYLLRKSRIGSGKIEGGLVN